MEDSEKRRERLKAMRSEAAEAETSSYTNPAAISGSLANPLLENPVAAAAHNVAYTTPRFDFYTDPMAAFSANRRSGAGNQAAQGTFRPPGNSSSPAAQFSSPSSGSWNPRMTPSSAHQMQNYHSPSPRMTPSPVHHMQEYRSPSQGMHQPQVPYYNAASIGNPGSTPFPMHQGPPGPYGHLPYNNASQRGPYPVHEANHRPKWYPNRGNVNHSGRGQWRGGSGRSQFSGQSGGRGRGRGFHSHGAEASKPESFYDKSMFEDPWELLEPVVWKGQNASASSGSWLPESIGVKKARVSEPSIKLNSQQSLAEYLAASFNEAANHSPSA